MSSSSNTAGQASNQYAASPSRPVDIASPQLAAQDIPDQFTQRTPQGTPDLRSLRAHYGTPPVDLPRNQVLPGSSVTSPPGPLSSSPAHTPLLHPSSRTGTPPPNANILDDLSDSEKAKVLRRHLVSREERTYANSVTEDASSRPGTSLGSAAAGPSSSYPRQDSDTFPLPYDVLGGDVTHDIYKWQSDRRLRSARSASFSGPQGNKHPAFEHIREPGGFRRNYLLLRAEEQDAGESEDGHGEGGQTRMLNNFIDFLYIFGHFAGEDLEEVEEEDEGEAVVRANTLENGVPSTLTPKFSQAPTLVDGNNQQGATERSPLMKRTQSRSVSRRRQSRRLSSAAGGPHGDATVIQAVLMLLKSFIGTGVLFLGKAFLNGGILFSAVTLVFIAIISLWSFLLLVRTKLVVSGSFGDIGGALYGPPMRFAILSSITLSQLGFACAYLIFTASNLQAFILGVTKCGTYVSTLHLILVQLIVLVPLSLVRNLAKLSTTALVADAFILVGLVYIFGNEIAVLGTQGMADVELFNPKDYALLIGTAVFSFEGIGLIIPVTDSMREPHKFPRALTGVMIFLTVLLAGAGVLAYAAYGKEVQTVILVNLPQEQKFVQVVQFLYSMAILLSIPLQLFPALRIMENGLFTRSGKLDSRVKWEKNALRCGVVALCTVVSWLGAADLDKFVAFIGSFACVPLCYVYPPMLHYRACARTRRQKIADIALMVFGAAAAVFTTVQTIKLMIEPNNGPAPKLGHCPT